MTLRQTCGYLCCAAGLGPGVFALYGLIAWQWGILAAVLLLLGWFLLRRRKSDRYGECGDGLPDAGLCHGRWDGDLDIDISD